MSYMIFNIYNLQRGKWNSEIKENVPSYTVREEIDEDLIGLPKSILSVLCHVSVYLVGLAWLPSQASVTNLSGIYMDLSLSKD